MAEGEDKNLKKEFESQYNDYKRSTVVLIKLKMYQFIFKICNFFIVFFFSKS